MKETFDGVTAFFKDQADRATRSVIDFVDHKDTKAAVAWTKSAANTVADEAIDLGKNAAHSVKSFAEHEDTKAAVAWTKDAISSTADEAVQLGKRAVHSEMAKDAATGAAIGAAVAVPIPIIGPVFGAVVGAGMGVFKNFKSGSSKSDISTERISTSKTSRLDIHKLLIELDDLRQKGILSQEEFEFQKQKVLKS
jgi:hypothetical protein